MSWLQGRESNRLSVIIPAYNAEGTLGPCLESVFANLPKDVEVIVTDDGSSDRTSAIASQFPCRTMRFPQNCGVSTARNAGARAAFSDKLFFLDADILVPHGMLEAVLATFENNPDVVAFFGSYTADTPARSVASRFKNLLHHFTHQNSRSDAATFCGGFGGIRRDVLLAAGGFCHRRAALEDVDLGYRLSGHGYRILLVKALQFTHLKTYTFWSLVRSDLFGRAIPWIELMLEHRTGRSDLNTKPNHVVSVALCCLIPLFVILSLFDFRFAAAVSAMFLLLAFLNGAFLKFVVRKEGVGMAVSSYALLIVMYWVCGVGAVVGFAKWWFRVRSENAAAELSE